MCKKIISFFVVFAIVASSLLPTFAAETGSFYRPVGITEWADERDPNGGFSNILEDYDSYVEDLQTDLGTVTLIDGGVRVYFSLERYLNSSFVHYTSHLITENSFTVSFHCSDTGTSSSPTRIAYRTKSFNAPFAGTYQIGIAHQVTGPCNVDLAELESGNCVKGQNFDLGIAFMISPTGINSPICVSGQAWVDFYPHSDSTITSQDISINSRPSSIIGDYGIIGDDGTIIKVDGDMIVDESSNTIYNPVTNTTTNFTNYTYDYSDRSYNLTLEDGSTMKVIYGDENITINEGDTIYNIYYLIEDDSGGGSGDGGDESGDKHTHDYTSEITKQPSCLISGVRTFTCSCGDSYTKTISATGHDWVISQQVPTTYDPETGEQTQAGYTVYVCGTCAEQYKSTDGSAPPNGSSGGDDSSGGFGDIIVGLFSVIGDIIGGLLEGALVLATKALEALTGLGSLFTQMVETILGFFGGFLDFLSAMFPFLPEETITILNFGLILMIAAAVFNKFFK